MVKCSLYYTFDVTANGNQSTNWGGFAQIQSQIGNITGLLNSTANSSNTQFSNSTWITTDYKAMQNMNLNLYYNNINATVYSPDPIATTNALMPNTPNSSLPTIVPRFIQSGLGPNGTAGTMVDDIDSGLRVTELVKFD
jgi:hypothetical protein